MADKNRQNVGWLKYVLALGALLLIAVGATEFLQRGAAVPTNISAVNQTNPAQPFPRELRDGNGESFVIPQRPNRIVSQTLGTDEILLDICESNRIVALSSLAEDANYSNAVEKAKAIAGRVTTGAEQILQMQPDLIFVANYSRAETVDLLRASNAPVFRFSNFSSLEDIENNIRTVGFATGCDAEAEKLISKMTDELAAISARVPRNQSAPRVMSFGGGITAGKNTTFDNMARAAGAINVSAENGISEFGKISQEKIIEWQPDFIVAGANQNEIETKRQQLLNDPLIKTTKAAKNGNVIVIDNRHYLAVTHHVVRAIETLADALYGKRQPNN